jgi:hypothetical protein
MSVNEGSRPPHLTDSHGHRPRNPPDLARPEHRPSSGTQPRAGNRAGPASRPGIVADGIRAQGSDHGAVSPVRFRAGDLSTQHRDLVPEDQDLCVLSGVTPGHEHQPAEHPDHGQVDETDEDERRAYSTRS